MENRGVYLGEDGLPRRCVRCKEAYRPTEVGQKRCLECLGTDPRRVENAARLAKKSRRARNTRSWCEEQVLRAEARLNTARERLARLLDRESRVTAVLTPSPAALQAELYGVAVARAEALAGAVDRAEAGPSRTIDPDDYENSPSKDAFATPDSMEDVDYEKLYEDAPPADPPRAVVSVGKPSDVLPEYQREALPGDQEGQDEEDELGYLLDSS